MGELFVSNTTTLDLVGALTTGMVIFGFNFLIVALAAYAFWRERLGRAHHGLASARRPGQ